MLEPAEDKEVRVEDRQREIEFRTPWQKLVFARNLAQITAMCWDSEGEGRLDLNLLEKSDAGGFSRGSSRPTGESGPSAVQTARDGNVVRYGPFEWPPAWR